MILKQSSLINLFVHDYEVAGQGAIKEKMEERAKQMRLLLAREVQELQGAGEDAAVVENFRRMREQKIILGPGAGAGATSASLLSQTFAPGSRTSTSLTPSASNVGKIMSVSSTSNTQNSVNEAVMKGMRLGLGGAGGMGAAGVGVGAGVGPRAGGGLDETLNMNFANSLSSSNGGGARSSGSPEAGGTGESTSASKRRINAR
eukprot:g12028.t1